MVRRSPIGATAQYGKLHGSARHCTYTDKPLIRTGCRLSQAEYWDPNEDKVPPTPLYQEGVEVV